MTTLRLKTIPDADADFLNLPWSTPLEYWPDELAVRLPRGRHRHVVRFIEYGGEYFACKELRPDLADREYELLDHLKEEGLPVVDLVGVADDRTTPDGEPLDSVLITRHLAYSLPYLHLFAGRGSYGLHDHLIDALAVLLTQVHLAGVFWGDCSLGNTLFRRDAGELVAYLVDTETGEHHTTLTDGQRLHDLEIATENIAGGLYELEVLGRLPDGVDPFAVAEQLSDRYESLWAELTATDEVAGDELWRIQARMRRLNDLGFDVSEIEMVETGATPGDGPQQVAFRPRVVEEGHHKRELLRLTGIEAEENQARRLLSALHGYGAWLGREQGRELPDAVAAYRWLAERYEPTIATIPDDLRNRLTDAEIFHQVLDHLWFLSEEAKADVGLETATRAYVESILPELPQERVVIESDDLEDGLLTS